MSAQQDFEQQSMATSRERALSALADACEGWRSNRRCVDESGGRLAHPHPGCLQAQYRHDVILLDAGLPR